MDEMTYSKGNLASNMVTRLPEVEVLFKNMQFIAKHKFNDCSATMKEELASWCIDIKRDLKGVCLVHTYNSTIYFVFNGEVEDPSTMCWELESVVLLLFKMTMMIMFFLVVIKKLLEIIS
jgi:hypothetical protein